MPEPEYRLYVAALLDKVHKLIEPLQNLKHKGFRSFSGKCFRFFFGLILKSFRKRQEKKTVLRSDDFILKNKNVYKIAKPLIRKYEWVQNCHNFNYSFSHKTCPIAKILKVGIFNHFTYIIIKKKNNIFQYWQTGVFFGKPSSLHIL